MRDWTPVALASCLAIGFSAGVFVTDRVRDVDEPVAADDAPRGSDGTPTSTEPRTIVQGRHVPAPPEGERRPDPRAPSTAPTLVRGRVVDSVDGSPRSHVTVRVRTPVRDRRFSAVTDDDGRFEFSPWFSVDLEPWRSVRFEAGGISGSASADVSFAELLAGEEVELALPPQPPVRGRLLDARTGAPIADATVRLSAPWGIPEHLRYECRTGPDGRFETEERLGPQTIAVDVLLDGSPADASRAWVRGDDPRITVPAWASRLGGYARVVELELLPDAQLDGPRDVVLAVAPTVTLDPPDSLPLRQVDRVTTWSWRTLDVRLLTESRPRVSDGEFPDTGGIEVLAPPIDREWAVVLHAEGDRIGTTGWIDPPGVGEESLGVEWHLASVGALVVRPSQEVFAGTRSIGLNVYLLDLREEQVSRPVKQLMQQLGLVPDLARRGDPIPYAVTAWPRARTDDPRPHVRLDDLPVGRWTFEVRAPGFTAQQFTATIEAGGETEVDVELAVAPDAGPLAGVLEPPRCPVCNSDPRLEVRHADDDTLSEPFAALRIGDGLRRERGEDALHFETPSLDAGAWRIRARWGPNCPNHGTDPVEWIVAAPNDSVVLRWR